MCNSEETCRAPEAWHCVAWSGSCREMPRDMLMTTMVSQLQSQPQNTGDARAMGHLLWKDEDVDCCWPRPKRYALLT